LKSPSNNGITKITLKIEEFSTSFPSFSLKVDWRERERMTSSVI